MGAQAAGFTSFLADIPPWAIGIGALLCLCLLGAGLVLLRPKIRYSRTINTFAELKRQADEYDDAKACREVFLMLHDGKGVARDAKEANITACAPSGDTRPLPGARIHMPACASPN